MNFDKCVHLYYPHPYQDKEYFQNILPIASANVSPSPISNHCSDFYYHRLAFPVLERHMNWIIAYEFFDECSFTEQNVSEIHSGCWIYLQLIHFLLLSRYSIAWIYYRLFIYSPVNGNLSYFQFAGIIKKYAMNIRLQGLYVCICVFVCEYVCMYISFHFSWINT